MKKTLLAVGLTAASGCMTLGAHAALLGNSTLSIEAGSSFAFVDFPGDVQTIGVEGIVLGTVRPYVYSAETVMVQGIDYFLLFVCSGNALHDQPDHDIERNWQRGHS